MEWGEVAKIALGSGVVSAAASMFIGWLKEHLKDSKEVRLLAMRIVGRLELYAIECSEEIYSCQMCLADHNFQSGAPLPRTPKIPELPTLPEESALKVLEKGILARLVWLETELRYAKFDAANASEHDDPPEAIERYYKLLGYLGDKAFRLSSDIRSKYDLPEISDKPVSKHREALEKMADFYQEDKRKDLGIDSRTDGV